MTWQMKSKKALYVFTFFIVMGMYDLVAVYILPDKLPSISLLTQEKIGIHLHVVDFVLGLVAGHLFFNMTPGEE